MYGYCGWQYVLGFGIDTPSSSGLSSSDSVDSLGCVAIGMSVTLCATRFLYANEVLSLADSGVSDPVFFGYIASGSLKPSPSCDGCVLSPGSEPSINASCSFGPSTNVPNTQLPCTNPIVWPTPDVEADVTGMTTLYHGRLCVGSNVLSPMCLLNIRTRTRFNCDGSLLSSTTPIKNCGFDIIMLFQV